MRKITLLPFLMLVLAACGVTTPSSSSPTSTPTSTTTSTVTTSMTTSTPTSTTPTSSETSTVTSIQAARLLSEGADVTIRGVVTRVVRQRNFYVQQGDFGITVFGYEGAEAYTVVQGDYVEVYGFIGFYNGLVQLTGAAGSGLPEVTKLSGTAPTVTPLELTEETYVNANLATNHDGRLVLVKKLSLAGAWTPLLTDASYPTAGGVNVNMLLGSKTIVARFDRYINVTDRQALNTFFGGLTSGQKVDYEGVLGDFNGIQLAVSIASDFRLNTDAAILPTSLTVTAPATPAEVVVGLGLQLSANILPANADDKSVTWSSASPEVATVSSTGLVTGVSVGTAVITATSVAASSVSGTLSVTVNPAPVTLDGVEFGIGDPTLKVGQSINSQATLLPLGYVGQGITYTSSDNAIATVTSAGVIQARAVGSATITAAATEDGTKTDTLAVTVTAVDTIPNAKIAAAGTVVTVNGVITKIFATNEMYIQAGDDAIHVLGPTATFSTSGFAEGDFVQVSGPATNASTPRRVGTTTAGTVMSLLKIDFLTKPDVNVLTVTEASYNTTDIPVAQMWRIVQMDGLFPPQPWVNVVAGSSTNRNFKIGAKTVDVRISGFLFADQLTGLNTLFTDFWKNDVVNYNGILSYFSSNLQLLTAGVKDFTLVEAAPIAVDSITVASAGGITSIAEGVTLQLTATVLPANADVLTVSWSTSDQTKATVSETGLVTAVAAGSVDITATSTVDATKFGTISLTVTPPPASLEGVEIVASKTQLETSETLQLSVSYLPVGYVGQGVTWSSSATSIATVSVTGLVTAIAAGSVTITAESTENTSFKDTLDLTIVEPFKNIVINELYGGGGNSGAVYTNDFVELYNPNNYEVSLEGYALQYASTTGNFNNASNFFVFTSAHKIKANGYFLIQMAAGSSTFAALPTPDAIGTINLAGTGGKLALLKNNNQAMVSTTGKVDNTLSYLSDFVGFGAANQWEGDVVSPATSNAAATTANGTSVNRASEGVDTNSNKADFPTAATPTPRNSSFSG